MKKLLFIFLLCISNKLFTMEEKILLPNKDIINQQLTNLKYSRHNPVVLTNFLAKSNLSESLGGKCLTTREIFNITDRAIRRYSEANPSSSSYLETHKSTILETLLTGYVEAIAEVDYYCIPEKKGKP